MISGFSILSTGLRRPGSMGGQTSCRYAAPVYNMVDTHKHTSLYMSCIFIKNTHQNFSEEFGPAKHVLISQPRDQRRSLAISQREPLIPHRSARDTAAP
ncbi:hypothetical protein EYF80_000512 [Liparis tanakae]|uniref:Uncharacterized protein n=1 Tax=Liparis tanakae TaxID=230148 RepID=A0A4Z2JHJ6_9TELE|nr:hypothetical protein EYF80_000512 [Liparis tanakae]